MKNKNRIYTTLLIFTLLFLFLIVFFIWQITKEIKKNSEDLISARNNIVDLEAQINETNNFENNYETYKPDLEKIDQLFVDPNNPVDFIKFLENTASNSQITSQISLPALSPNSSSQQFITLRFISKGNFSNVLNFTKEIELGPYPIEIESLTIHNSDQNSIQNSGQTTQINNIAEDYSSRNVEATFTIKTFIKK
jgi:hypothetical protein